MLVNLIVHIKPAMKSWRSILGCLQAWEFLDFYAKDPMKVEDQEVLRKFENAGL